MVVNNLTQQKTPEKKQNDCMRVMSLDIWKGSLMVVLSFVWRLDRYMYQGKKWEKNQKQ